MKTIETKKVSVAEAIAIIERLNYFNDTFVYDQTTREYDDNVQYRHFDAYDVNGEIDSFALIEIVVDGKLAAVRFFNLFRDITVDLLLSDFTPDYSNFDQVINANDPEINLANKRAKKLYTINPVTDADDDIKFNHLNIYLKPNGALQLDGFFLCKNIETAYRRFVKAMSQAANDIPQLKGWDNWLPANKISEVDGSFFNENGDELFQLNDPRDTLAVDINEDTFYFFANFSPALKPLDGFNYDAATNYQPQTNWDNPHDFSVTGDLSERNIYGRIIAANIARGQEQERREMKADGIHYLLNVNLPQLHPFRNFYFETVINPYKSLDTLKKLGGMRIHEHDWRIETIDGTLLAKGSGSNDFNRFADAKLARPKQIATATFEVGKVYFSRDYRDCAFTILGRKKNIVSFALKDFEDDEVYIQRARIRKDSRGEFFVTKAEVLLNTFEKIEIYAADCQADESKTPSTKQIYDSLQRAIDKAILEYKFARVVGNQSKANFERELYLIAKKATRELKH